MADLDRKVEPVKLFHVTYSPKDVNEDLAPIIFLPGFFATNRSFMGVKYEIAKRTKRRVYVLELRNHGQSGYSKDFSLTHLVADLEHFLSVQNISRAIFAGHSMGGKSVLALSLKHPEKVEMLIVEDIPVVTSSEHEKQIKKICLLMKLMQAKLRQIPKHFSEKQAQAKLIPYVKKFWPMFVDNLNNQFALPFHKNNMGEFEWEMDIDVITGSCLNGMQKLEIDLSSNPTYPGKLLLLSSEKSPFRVQDDLNDYHKHFPQFQCRIFENGYHTFHAEVPELYIKFVSEFIGEESL